MWSHSISEQHIFERESNSSLLAPSYLQSFFLSVSISGDINFPALAVCVTYSLLATSLGRQSPWVLSVGLWCWSHCDFCHEGLNVGGDHIREWPRLRVAELPKRCSTEHKDESDTGSKWQGRVKPGAALFQIEFRHLCYTPCSKNDELLPRKAS